jgi:hypothetical protein
MPEESLNWIESGGGPLILLPEDSASRWLGVFGSSTDDVGNDYDRACATSDYIALRQLYDREAVILSGQPLLASWYPVSAEHGMIVRILWTEHDDTALLRMVQTIPDSFARSLSDQRATVSEIMDYYSYTPTDEIRATRRTRADYMLRFSSSASARITAELTGGRHLLFDSAEEGSDAADAIECRLTPGKYQILSGWHDGDPGTAFLVHQLRRLD